MHVIVEILVTILQTLYYTLESLVLLFVPNKYRRKDVSGQTVLITGAGSGIGREMSLRFAQLGCSLVLWDINKAANEETAEQVRRYKVAAHPYVCDLSSRDDIYKVAEKVKSDVGDIDILVNNAGIVTGRKFLQCPDTLIEKCMDVNINAHFWTTKCFLPTMLKRNKGHLVTIASGAGITGVNGLADYCASKFAAVGFDESLRIEIAVQGKDGVKTTCICPYYINTGMFSGVKTRFEHVLPIIETDDAVNRMMDAILTNTHIIYMPRFLYIIFGLKNMMPTKALILLGNFFGVSNSMDDFVGRNKGR